MNDDTQPLTTAGVEHTDLFSVRPGIPITQAFDELSVLLGCVGHLTDQAEMEGDRQAGSAARILSSLAKALINDMESGINRLR
ncbi:DUF3077 domain-containing protein [Pseudomonas sp. BP8]|uniref:DUF3077 domain-containing protein n=1 Tax=Pseudomonas sp. BP8 TaxID=2817864 RepID=UPI001AE196FC|nr:DUF3077 domain-containing protein [Pseudomonas sp. BP8]MBP2259492.1 hypothetical protein [Pseudomonas sp. BP8]HDS1734016.1 DUF3077 domain-containing protein [Pseudomonas putida]